MFVGVMQLHFALYDSQSLKDKRSVKMRLIARTRQTFNVSMAEIDEHDSADRLVLGAVVTSASHSYALGALQKIENFVERLGLAELLDAPKLVERF